MVGYRSRKNEKISLLWILSLEYFRMIKALLGFDEDVPCPRQNAHAPTFITTQFTLRPTKFEAQCDGR